MNSPNFKSMMNNPTFKYLNIFPVDYDSESSFFIFNYIYNFDVHLESMDMLQLLDVLLQANLYQLTYLELICSIKVAQFITMSNREAIKRWCHDNKLLFLKNVIVSSRIKIDSEFLSIYMDRLLEKSSVSSESSDKNAT